MKIYYNPKLKKLARELRNNSILSEVLLWNQLKTRKMGGYQFMRQKPISEYIVDFFCSKLKLVIEIDGESHIDKIEKDKIRQERLERLGLTFLRFNDLDVKSNLNGVLIVIENWIAEHEEKQPLTPFIKGEYKSIAMIFIYSPLLNKVRLNQCQTNPKQQPSALAAFGALKRSFKI